MEVVRNAKFVSRLWLSVGGLLLLLAVLVVQSVLTSWHQHEERAYVETDSAARVLQGDLAGLMDRIKLALHTVATEQARWLGHRGAEDRTARDYIASIHANLPEVRSIRVADAAGQVIFQTRSGEATGEGIAGQAYFARLRESREKGIVLSAPHREEVDGPQVVVAARRLEFADGRFAGAVVAPILVERLASMLSAADVGIDGVASLRGEGLELIARRPPAGPRTENPYPPGPLREMVARGQVAGSFRAMSSVDGIERVYSYRKVAGYPLHVTVARATAAYLDHWRSDMSVVFLLSAVLLAVTVGATVMVDRAWRHQRRVTRLLEMQAHTDSLTGLANRRRFFEMAEAELVRTRRYDAPLSLLMLDIDHFKNVNDVHGHRAGDRVLRELARVCLEVLRAVDVVGRVGGEEFAILLPETDVVGAVDVAERLREAVAKNAIVRDEGVPLRVTVSIGVAPLAGQANLDTLLNQADTALYDAKHRGRDRVCVFSPPA